MRIPKYWSKQEIKPEKYDKYCIWNTASHPLKHFKVQEETDEFANIRPGDGWAMPRSRSRSTSESSNSSRNPPMETEPANQSRPDSGWGPPKNARFQGKSCVPDRRNPIPNKNIPPIEVIVIDDSPSSTPTRSPPRLGSTIEVKNSTTLALIYLVEIVTHRNEDKLL